MQVPARRAAERDEGKIARWREDTWPVIKGRRRTWGLALLSRRVRSGPEAVEGTYLGRRRCTPVVKVTGGHDTRVSLAALIATRPGVRPRLIYRTHRARRGDKRKGFTETDYARFPAAASSWTARSCWSGTA